MFTQNPKIRSGGFTLVEAIVGTAVFLIVALAVYQAYTVTMNVIRLSREKITATALGNEQFEIIHNLPYSDVGIVSGLPLGKIPATQTLLRDGKEFVVKTTIRNIDDAFDGTIGGDPNDSSPADYKLVELEITCDTCHNFSPLNLTTWIAANGLESSSTNGALFVKVFDASGQPIPDADIHIENNELPLDKLKDIFVENKGNTPVLFSFRDSKLRGVKVKTANSFSININEKALKDVEALVGQGNLSLTL